MVFSDLLFIAAFMPLFAVVYAIAGVGRTAAQNAVLTAFSLLFYAWGEPVFVFLMIGTAIINYAIGLGVARCRKKSLLAAGVGVNIAILAVFKYTGLTALPIGISFYTFQSISYLVDVYRGEARAQRSFGGMLLYISMFPQLIAGPIVRYSTVAEAISSRHVTAGDVAAGIERFVIGLSKKVLIANQMSEIVDVTLTLGSQPSTLNSLVGMAAFMLQIYFDFSGYSDMAIGIGRCIGFRFPENFNHPYCCNSITDFWRRWHMTLGSFFRDYVYIPLGGNRRHQALNILIVWALTGIWHGASANFALWGLYFGIIVMVEKYTILKVKRYIPNIILHVYALVLVYLGWGLFYFEDFGAMQTFFSSLSDIGSVYGTIAAGEVDLEVTTALQDKALLWVTAIVLCMPVRRWVEKPFSHQAFMPIKAVVHAALLALCVAMLVGATNNPFIYTRF